MNEKLGFVMRKNSFRLGRVVFLWSCGKFSSVFSSLSSQCQLNIEKGNEVDSLVVVIEKVDVT